MADLQYNIYQDYRSLEQEGLGEVHYFVERFGDLYHYPAGGENPHFLFACHAALPVVLTPDLLYQIWIHFQDEKNRFPYEVVSDLLLSGLCREVRPQLFEMEADARDYFLKALRRHPRFDQEREKELARFLRSYAASHYTQEHQKNIRESQHFAAIAYLNPQQAAREIISSLNDALEHKDNREQRRLGSLIDVLNVPLDELPELVAYGRAVRAHFSGRERETVEQIAAMPIPADELEKGKVDIAGATLIVNSELKKLIRERIEELKDLKSKEQKKESTSYFAKIHLLTDGHTDTPRLGKQLFRQPIFDDQSININNHRSLGPPNIYFSRWQYDCQKIHPALDSLLLSPGGIYLLAVNMEVTNEEGTPWERLDNMMLRLESKVGVVPMIVLLMRGQEGSSEKTKEEREISSRKYYYLRRKIGWTKAETAERDGLEKTGSGSPMRKVKTVIDPESKASNFGFRLILKTKIDLPNDQQLQELSQALKVSTDDLKDYFSNPFLDAADVQNQKAKYGWLNFVEVPNEKAYLNYLQDFWTNEIKNNPAYAVDASIENLSERIKHSGKPAISHQEFRRLFQITETQMQDVLSELQKRGRVLSAPPNPKQPSSEGVSEDMVVLRPEVWLPGVARLFDPQGPLNVGNGEVPIKELSGLLKKQKLEAEPELLIQFLEHFGLAFYEKERDALMLPSAWGQQAVKFNIDVQNEQVTYLAFAFSTYPPGLFSVFQARLGTMRWQVRSFSSEGLVLINGEDKIELIQRKNEKEIQVRIAGPDQEDTARELSTFLPDSIFSLYADAVAPSINQRTIPPHTTPNLTQIPAGAFTMGWLNKERDGEGYDDEKPAHEVKVNDFYISKYQVTFEEYDAFCEATDREKPKDRGWGRGSRPAIYVDWYDAIEYCNWLSGIWGLEKVYEIDKSQKDPNNKSSEDNKKWLVKANWEANGYRLPTEAEWEYAARGGPKSKGYTYAGSNKLDEVGWYSGNSGSKTHPVGEKPPNELGLYDMSGNVYEWCWDWFGENYYRQFEKTKADAPKGPESGNYRVVRVGSWLDSDNYCRVAIRGGNYPDFRSGYQGFRLARTV